MDCDAVRESAADLPGSSVARTYKYMCSNPGQEMIVQDIQEQQLDAGRRGGVQSAHARAHVPQGAASAAA